MEAVLGVGVVALIVLVLSFLVFMAFVVGVIVWIRSMVRRAAGEAASAVSSLGAGVGQQLTRGVAGRGLGRGVGNQAVGALLRVGEDELRKGIAFVKKTVDEEMLKSDPKRMQMVVAKLAQKNQGELTRFQVMTELSISQRLALDTLQALVEQEVCFVREDGDRQVYVFPAFKEKRDVKVCDYCDSTFELAEVEGNACKGCGAPELRVVSTI